MLRLAEIGTGARAEGCEETGIRLRHWTQTEFDDALDSLAFHCLQQIRSNDDSLPCLELLLHLSNDLRVKRGGLGQEDDIRILGLTGRCHDRRSRFRLRLRPR